MVLLSFPGCLYATGGLIDLGDTSSMAAQISSNGTALAATTSSLSNYLFNLHMSGYQYLLTMPTPGAFDSYNANTFRGLLWTQSTGFTSMGLLSGGSFSTAFGITRNGQMVVGAADDAIGGTGNPSAVIWSPSTGFTQLKVGGTVQYNTIAYGTNTTGSFVVGEAFLTADTPTAFWWSSATGIKNIDVTLVIGGSVGSIATGVSDAGIAVGYAITNISLTQNQGFAWTEGGGGVTNPLGFLNGGNNSAAYGISFNSDNTNVIIVGTANDGPNGNPTAVQWTGALGATVISKLGTGLLNGGSSAAAFATNASGNVIVGWAQDGANGNVNRAFRYTAATGLQTVEDWLRNNGVTIPQDVSYAAYGVSDDGSTVVGQLADYDAFIARVSSNGSGLISIAKFATSIATVGSIPQNIINVSELMLQGAHGHPLLNQIEQDKASSFGIVGDWGFTDFNHQPGQVALAEINGAHRLSEQVHVGLALGKTRSIQAEKFNTKIVSNGAFLNAELIGSLPGKHIVLTINGVYLWGDANIRRGYLNAGVQNYSIGSTPLSGITVRGRLDWPELVHATPLTLAPYVEVNTMHYRIRAYTEHGGGFPCTFFRQHDGVNEVHAGINGEIPVEKISTTFFGTFAAAHRFQKQEGPISGEILGLFIFKVPGFKFHRDWVHVALGTKYKFKKGIGILTINGTSEGEAPRMWIAASYRLEF